MHELKQGPKKSYCLVIALSPFVLAISLLTTWLVIS